MCVRSKKESFLISLKSILIICWSVNITKNKSCEFNSISYLNLINVSNSMLSEQSGRIHSVQQNAGTTIIAIIGLQLVQVTARWKHVLGP